MADYEILKTINSPKDVKDLSFMALKELCDEMRAAIINRVSKHGGHLGPNLGVVELTTALHYVFDSPNDKLVWDVSHQSYPHKLLTGRAAAFYDDEHYGDASGYTAPQESEHDIFTVGHTSTSVSLASGLAKARDLKGGTENVIAIIGDGSLSGGEAFEGLDNVGDFKSNFIVIVNDNEMSIAKNYGGLYGNLAKLRETKGLAEDNYFKALGFDYVYVEEGNDVVKLIAELMKVKDSDHPVVVHVHTLKGCGYQPAVDDKEAFHWTMPFDVESGKMLPEPIKLFGRSKSDTANCECKSSGIVAKGDKIYHFVFFAKIRNSSQITAFIERIPNNNLNQTNPLMFIIYKFAEWFITVNC